MCSAETAKRVMATVVVFFAIFECQWFYIISHAEKTNKCLVTSGPKEKMANIYKYFDAIFYSYLPIGSMVITNTLIIIKLVIEKRLKQNPSIGKVQLIESRTQCNDHASRYFSIVYYTHDAICYFVQYKYRYVHLCLCNGIYFGLQQPFIKYNCVYNN